jgi:hypothetical protein
MSDYNPSPFEMPVSAMPVWYYQWAEINLKLHAYIRYRMEDTLDGMPKPYVQTLAYVQEIGDGAGWEWRALMHVGDKVEVMESIPCPLPYQKITLLVEETTRMFL